MLPRARPHRVPGVSSAMRVRPSTRTHREQRPTARAATTATSTSNHARLASGLAPIARKARTEPSQPIHSPLPEFPWFGEASSFRDQREHHHSRQPEPHPRANDSSGHPGAVGTPPGHPAGSARQRKSVGPDHIEHREQRRREPGAHPSEHCVLPSASALNGPGDGRAGLGPCDRPGRPRGICLLRRTCGTPGAGMVRAALRCEGLGGGRRSGAGGRRRGRIRDRAHRRRLPDLEPTGGHLRHDGSRNWERADGPRGELRGPGRDAGRDRGRDGGRHRDQHRDRVRTDGRVRLHRGRLTRQPIPPLTAQPPHPSPPLAAPIRPTRRARPGAHPTP